MTEEISASESKGSVIYLDTSGVSDDLALQRMAVSVRELRPSIERSVRHQGHGVTMAALIVIVANLVIDHGDETLIADVFRQNADMLDPEARCASSVGRARVS